MVKILKTETTDDVSAFIGVIQTRKTKDGWEVVAGENVMCGDPYLLGYTLGDQVLKGNSQNYEFVRQLSDTALAFK